jgi:hypothetical protein
VRPLRPERRAQIAQDKESGTQLQAWLGPRRGPKKPKAPPSIRDKDWANVMGEAAAHARTGNWDGAQPRHFVALYDYLHSKVYGVACAELTPNVRFLVSKKAEGMLAREFGGDCAAMAEFLRWTWQREDWRERNLPVGRGRIGPWLQFNGAVLTDWRLDGARRQKTGTR